MRTEKTIQRRGPDRTKRDNEHLRGYSTEEGVSDRRDKLRTQRWRIINKYM